MAALVLNSKSSVVAFCLVAAACGSGSAGQTSTESSAPVPLQEGPPLSMLPGITSPDGPTWVLIMILLDQSVRVQVQMVWDDDGVRQGEFQCRTDADRGALPIVRELDRVSMSEVELNVSSAYQVTCTHEDDSFKIGLVEPGLDVSRMSAPCGEGSLSEGLLEVNPALICSSYTQPSTVRSSGIAIDLQISVAMLAA